MAWISKSGYLNQSEMENNANIIIAYYRSIGVNDITIAALLGNMQAESTLNPILNEVGGSGYGLVQWTPQSVLINHASALGYSNYSSGDTQLKVIIAEIKGESGTNEWYSTQAFINNYKNSGATDDMVGITGQQFLSNSMNWSADKLAVLFMTCYERPSTNPATNHYTQRKQNALNWLQFMGGVTAYNPRLTDSGIQGSPYWYSKNPFYQSGYGLPNCTCYAWGRFWEISDPNKQYVNEPKLSLQDAGKWYSYTQDGYTRGLTPKLGAVICFYNNYGGAGHVAIVEEIKENGDIVTSNSAYGSTFFYLSTLKKNNGYNTSSYTCQGFIYNPYAGSSPTPIPIPENKKHKFNFVLFNKRRKNLYG